MFDGIFMFPIAWYTLYGGISIASYTRFTRRDNHTMEYVCFSCKCQHKHGTERHGACGRGVGKRVHKLPEANFLNESVGPGEEKHRASSALKGNGAHATDRRAENAAFSMS